jgi:hypothetical protein
MRTHKLNLLLCTWLAVVAGVAAQRVVSAYGEVYADLFFSPQNAGDVGAFAAEAIVRGVHGFVQFAFAAVLILLAAALSLALAGLLLRRPWLLRGLRGSCVLLYTALGLAWIAVQRVVNLQFETELFGKLTKPEAFYMVWTPLGPWLVVAVLTGLVHIQLWRRTLINAHTGAHDEGPAPGDEVLENLRTDGRDPLYRRSLLRSAGIHVCVLVLIPFLLNLVGCVEPYRVPKGSGNPVVALVKIVKPKKKKKKKMVLNPNSAIYFRQPDLDDTELIKKVQQETELTYRADPNAMAGKMGRGGGKKGGWPDGMENHKVRFIRMKYSGGDWDDGMDAVSRADLNFLEEFHNLTGFKIATQSEAHGMRLLKRYPKGYAPPFVYMTGNGRIHVGSNEMKVMRKYLLGGGMLFADCGGRGWHNSFMAFARGLFPDKRIIEIADDDPIFQMPYQFANGAPPLWHHGGRRALGMKHKGRWVIFYHPGDVNDAWKNGHSGLRPDQARGAFQMGVNIVYYAFTNYLEQTRKYRK